MIKFFIFLFFAFFFVVPLSFSKHVSFGQALCKNPGYSCLTIVEKNTWENLWPNENERDLVRRLNRTNLKLSVGMTLAIPTHLKSLTLNQANPLPIKQESSGEKKLIVDLNQLVWGAYDETGALIRWGPISAGKDWCPDVGYRCKTPSGEYTILYKGSSRCKSSRYPINRGGAPMPYCMFFRRGYALHGSPEVPGYNASHGCVRLFTEDAKWLNENFILTPTLKNPHGTKVTIHSSQP